MSAENLLLILDECDEINVVLREFLQPAAVCALLCLLVSVYVGWQTGSLLAGASAIALSAWLALGVSWLLDRPRPVVVAVTPPRRYR